MRPISVFLVAGEISGDMLGGRLMAALRNGSGADRLVFRGVGGPRMVAQGLDSLFPMDELSLMGFIELVPHLPRLIRRLRQTHEAIRRDPPDLVLTIDSPGFALRLQRRLQPLSLTRIHYVAPQAWAWREGRAARLALDVDQVLALLPFEPPFFARYGVNCAFVGHPIVEEAGKIGNGRLFRRRHEIPDDVPLICLLPGSRQTELEQHLPVLEQTVERLWQRFPRLRVVLPTLASLAPTVRQHVQGWKMPILVLEDRAERFDAYATSWLAIAASGTVALELAMAGLPMITIYKAKPFTGWLARRLIRVAHVNLVNLILDRPAIPELLQEDCHAERIAASAARLLENDGMRQQQRIALAETVHLLGRDGPRPSERAADCVLATLRQRGLDAG